MSKTWFTADTHFGHANIIRLCDRPFGSVEEMDAVLIANWNGVVGPRDEVWHLGDFSHREASDYLRRLNGRKHLIFGNHDRDVSRKDPAWASAQAYAEPTVDGVPLRLFHYGLRTWRGSFRGALHLYGHSHGRLPGDRQCVDVGVDYPEWGYQPVQLRAIQEHLLRLPERHQPDDAASSQVTE